MRNTSLFTRLLSFAALAVLPLSVMAASPADAAVSDPAVAAAGNPGPGGGFFTVDATGFVTAAGGATHRGGVTIPLNRPIVGMGTTPTGAGYWLVSGDGGIFTYGDARFFGSTGNLRLNKPIVGIATTPSGNGYWLVANDGGIFSFGDAKFYGSTGNLHLNRPIVGMAPTPSGHGYWMVATDGGIFSFGDAKFYGSTGAVTLNQPIRAMLAAPSGEGYQLVANDGGIFTFGNAWFFGSAANKPGFDRTVGITRFDDVGYRIVNSSRTSLTFSANTPPDLPPGQDPNSTDCDPLVECAPVAPAGHGFTFISSSETEEGERFNYHGTGPVTEHREAIEQTIRDAGWDDVVASHYDGGLRWRATSASRVGFLLRTGASNLGDRSFLTYRVDRT